MGLALAASQILEQPYSIGAGREAMRRLCARAERPTAVVCGNDVLALGALLEATALGLRVPEDISITGFDDLDLAREIGPGLTTIHAPLEEMGRLTADYHLSTQGPDDPPLHLELPAEFVVRGSTGPAPGRGSA